jgi:hypothetical protein
MALHRRPGARLSDEFTSQPTTGVNGQPRQQFSTLHCARQVMVELTGKYLSLSAAANVSWRLTFCYAATGVMVTV